ncbi:hypothetical protein DICVIV_09027 [Dictyocaulus viviparus]|uniref:KATNIP domain-containing protein n=1 Tax=Dictyocaulus viviparus TaxID=29172 RepID=A0A0D8XRD2_DICVI|nr:hypothetical protein DICVIV_09027 [Dictyocaulus viviparus]
MTLSTNCTTVHQFITSRTFTAEQMWLTPMLPNRCARVFFVFDNPIAVSTIIIYNYRKTPTRGVRHISRTYNVTKLLLTIFIRITIPSLQRDREEAYLSPEDCDTGNLNLRFLPLQAQNFKESTVGLKIESKYINLIITLRITIVFLNHITNIKNTFIVIYDNYEKLKINIVVSVDDLIVYSGDVPCSTIEKTGILEINIREM